MMMTGNGQLSVPPGFRFHPTDEELLYYYLKKKVSYESIDLDVIREVDLNKLEPWDLKDKCSIGSGPQNEWYFFSHKDKKYPTGTRTNRATAAGFWKATGRDKVIHHLTNTKRIGMRKTLVFYTGRAPHGLKTDWIMHEYRLEDDNDIQEDGWVVCRVFKKKTHTRSYESEIHSHEEEQAASVRRLMEPKQSDQNLHTLYHDHHNGTIFHGSMQLPQLFSTESSAANHHHHQHPSNFLCPQLGSLNNNINEDKDCSQSLLRLTSTASPYFVPQEKFTTDWSFLDKLLTSHQTMDHQNRSSCNPSSQPIDHVGSSMSVPRLPFQYLGCDASDNFKI
ncbi:hypothetical protein ACET3Z_017624 [Daucus carota]